MEKLKSITTIKTWYRPTWKELAVAIPAGSALIWFITGTLVYLAR